MRRVQRAPEPSALPRRPSDRKSWEIVEEFELEGCIYRIQRRALDQTLQPLANREREVLSLVDGGMSRKQIAQELGLAPSTVGVLLHRAATKLGAKSRTELMSRFREQVTSGNQ